MLRRFRDFFHEADVLEVDTPALSAAAASDLHIESLEVRSTLSAEPLYLHTSPEFRMKRLLAAGFPDIYSICRVFRDGEAGQQHQPEFTLVEWYRKGFSLAEIIRDTVRAIGTALQTTELQENVRIFDYRTLFHDQTGIDPFTASCNQLADLSDADQELRSALGEQRDDWLDLLFATVVSKRFADGELSVVQHFPKSQAALARTCPDDDEVADRFEVFLGPTELANGYVELRDSREQLDRISSDQRKRKARGLPQRPHDLALLEALDAGLPDCAGVAVGLERLLMAQIKTNSINDVVTFSYDSDN